MKTNTWKQYADAEILKQVTVRPIRPDEKARWDKLMSERHYLKNARLVGRQLRQVGELASGYFFTNQGRRDIFR